MTDVLDNFHRGRLFFHTKKGNPVESPLALFPLADTHAHITALRTLHLHQAYVRAAFAGLCLLVAPIDPLQDFNGEDSAFAPDIASFFTWFAKEIELAQKELDTLSKKWGMKPPEFLDAPQLLDNIHLVAGVHPYGAAHYLNDKTVRMRLEKLLAHPLCVGVGEIGLDFGPYSDVPEDIQIKAFEAQLDFAHYYNLPVELHIRDAANDSTRRAHQLTKQLLERRGVPSAGCDLHCFTCDTKTLNDFVELGCHIAFGGASTFARSSEIREAACACPLDKLLSETDCPYMAPVPLRGTECEPAMTVFTVDMLAKMRAEQSGESPREIFRALWNNACAFFNV